MATFASAHATSRNALRTTHGMTNTVAVSAMASPRTDAHAEPSGTSHAANARFAQTQATAVNTTSGIPKLVAARACHSAAKTARLGTSMTAYASRFDQSLKKS